MRSIAHLSYPSNLQVSSKGMDPTPGPKQGPELKLCTESYVRPYNGLAILRIDGGPSRDL